MHYLQRHILKALTTQGPLRYKDLKPKEVDGNQFMYHMGRVLDEGYVKKGGITYILTRKGKEYADRVTLETFQVRAQPKIVTMLHAVNKIGEILFFERAREPFRGLVSLPYGKVHLNEKVKDAAHRELKEKTGLEGNLVRRGDAYLTVYEDGELLTHMLCHTFSVENIKGALVEKTPAGRCFWNEYKKIRPSLRAPGLAEIIKLLKRKASTPFFAEFFLDISK